MSQSEVQTCLAYRNDCLRAVVDPEFNRLHGQTIARALTAAFSTDLELASRQPDPFSSEDRNQIKLPPSDSHTNFIVKKAWRVPRLGCVNAIGMDALGHTTTLMHASNDDFKSGLFNIPLILKDDLPLPIQIKVHDGQATIIDGDRWYGDKRLKRYELNPEHREYLEDDLILSLIAQGTYLTDIKDHPQDFAADLLGSGLHTEAERLMTDKELEAWNLTTQNLASGNRSEPTTINEPHLFDIDTPNTLTISTHPMMFSSLPAIKTQPTPDRYFWERDQAVSPNHARLIDPKGPKISFPIEVVTDGQHSGHTICHLYFRAGSNTLEGYHHVDFNSGGSIVGLYERAKNQLRTHLD